MLSFLFLSPPFFSLFPSSSRAIRRCGIRRPGYGVAGLSCVSRPFFPPSLFLSFEGGATSASASIGDQPTPGRNPSSGLVKPCMSLSPVLTFLFFSSSLFFFFFRAYIPVERVREGFRQGGADQRGERKATSPPPSSGLAPFPFFFPFSPHVARRMRKKKRTWRPRAGTWQSSPDFSSSHFILPPPPFPLSPWISATKGAEHQPIGGPHTGPPPLLLSFFSFFPPFLFFPRREDSVEVKTEIGGRGPLNLFSLSHFLSGDERKDRGRGAVPLLLHSFLLLFFAFFRPCMQRRHRRGGPPPLFFSLLMEDTKEGEEMEVDVRASLSISFLLPFFSSFFRTEQRGIKWGGKEVSLASLYISPFPFPSLPSLPFF